MGIFSEKLHSHSPSWTYQLLGIPHDYGNPHSLIPPLPASQLRKAVTAPMGSAFTRCQMAEQVPPFKEPPFSVIAKNLNDMHVIICIYIYMSICFCICVCICLCMCVYIYICGGLIGYYNSLTIWYWNTPKRRCGFAVGTFPIYWHFQRHQNSFPRDFPLVLAQNPFV